MAPQSKARANELHLSSAAEKAPAVGVNDRVQANHLKDREERRCGGDQKTPMDVFQPAWCFYGGNNVAGVKPLLWPDLRLKCAKSGPVVLQLCSPTEQYTNQAAELRMVYVFVSILTIIRVKGKNWCSSFLGIFQSFKVKADFLNLILEFGWLSVCVLL